MPQDTMSGAKANRYGHETARRIALQMGAVPLTKNSNEFMFAGRRITIRCARRDTQDVGATYKMLERVESVWAALQRDDGMYEVYELEPKVFLSLSRDSKGEGRVGLVRRRAVQERGKLIHSLYLRDERYQEQR